MESMLPNAHGDNEEIVKSINRTIKFLKVILNFIQVCSKTKRKVTGFIPSCLSLLFCRSNFLFGCSFLTSFVSRFDPSFSIFRCTVLKYKIKVIVPSKPTDLSENFTLWKPMLFAFSLKHFLQILPSIKIRGVFSFRIEN